MTTKTSIQTQQLVIDYMSALQERNLQKLLLLIDEKVDWHVPGNQAIAPWLGKRQTKQEVETFFRLLWQNTEAISGKVEHMCVIENVALISGNFATKMLQTEKIFRSMFFIEISFIDHKIIKYKLVEEAHGLMEALRLYD
jgi:ketosteroid isomerase-like protein